MVLRNKEIKMANDRHFNRIDIVEIKILIEKKVGNQRAEKYFRILDSFFGLKIPKSEFNKLCIAAIGRENVSLHNRLITSIVKNACLSRKPPPKRSKMERPVFDNVTNGYQRSCLQSLSRGRTPSFHDRKSKDRLSPLGPNGKPNSKELGPKALEQQSATELLSLGSRPIDGTSVEDGEEVNQASISPGIYSRSPVTPPLGIPWNGKGNRKVLGSLSHFSGFIDTCIEKGELPDTSSLMKRLEQKLEQNGLRISLDCVNLLNNGLDTFLKRLIKPSLELASSKRIEDNPLKTGHGPSNGTSGVWPVRYPQSSPVSVLDFRTAIEMNPRVLGEDWPTQLEKICLREFEIGVRD